MSDRNNNRTMKWFTTAMLIVILLAGLAMPMNTAIAAPANVTSGTELSSDGMDTYNISQASDTRGGADTALDLSVWTQTMYWQGYYGNVSKLIELSDGIGSVFNRWNVTAPEGEIFASRQSSIDWGAIQCASYSTVATEQISITGEGAERVNLTFSSSNVQPFSVGATNFGAGSCSYSTYLIDGTGSEGTYEEVLLESAGDMIYTSIVSNDGTSFTGETADYQMLVAEDGTDDVGTTYYWYAELE